MPASLRDAQSLVAIDRRLLEAAVEATLAAEGVAQLWVSLTVTDDAGIHELNRTWLAHDEPTDVISFPLREANDPDPLLGEVVISAERARREACARGIPLDEELVRYVVHGCLHLLGWDDRTEAERRAMHARQEEIVRALMAR